MKHPLLRPRLASESHPCPELKAIPLTEVFHIYNVPNNNKCQVKKQQQHFGALAATRGGPRKALE
jgi:hypothetical protein